MRRVCGPSPVRSAGLKHTRGDCFVIVSGKGGVGKTCLAVNLAIQCARRRHDVILLDADFGLANADILLNLTPRGDFADLLAGRRSVQELLVSGPAGLRVLGGASGFGRAAHYLTPEACSGAIEQLRRHCELVLVDCGAGLNSLTVALSLAGDFLIVVTTPEPTALADAYAVLKLLCNQGLVGRVGVVVNMARSAGEAVTVAGRLSRVAANFLGLSVEYLGFVPLDRHVALAVRARAPLALRYPRCDASRAMEGICERLGLRRTDTGRIANIWSRVASLFL